MAIQTITSFVLRTRMKLVEDNPRTYLGQELKELGQSLDKRQEEPLRGSYPPGLSGPSPVLIYDGQRRLTTYDKGYCPKVKKTGGMMVMIYTTENGKGLSEQAMWDICAEINRHRRNWTELEEGRWMERKLKSVMQELKIAEPSVALLHPDKFRRMALEKVASIAQVPETTVESRLKLVQFDPERTKVIETLLGERIVGAGTLIELFDGGYNVEQVLALLDEAAAQQGHPINWDALKLAPGIKPGARRAKQPPIRVTRRQVGQVLRQTGAPTRKAELRPLGEFKKELQRYESMTSGEGSRVAQMLASLIRWGLYLQDEPPLR